MLKTFLVATAALFALPQIADASDPAAQFLTKLFISVCVPNLGQPSKVREWAERHQLAKVESPAALDVFVGPGGHGAAWAVPSAQGSFALSIRGKTEACAVWSRASNAEDATAYFNKVVEGAKRPGIDVRVDSDSVVPGPHGKAHALVYNVRVPGAADSFEFTLLTAEQSGGAFQASMQAARASAH